MNCCDCQAQLADLSAETLDSENAHAMQQHFKECAHCYQEWTGFERTLFIVSSLRQPLPSPLATEQMWHRCSEHIFEKVEAERLNRPKSAPEYSGADATPGWRGWLVRQPRWSWASLAGAVALFGAVWFLAPSEGAPGEENFPPEGQLVALPGNTQIASLQNPPAMAAGLVNHHSATTIDPFTDYVGNTLVSYSTTSQATVVSHSPAAPRR